MRTEARGKLRLRYDHRCGYCGVSETDVGGPLTTDHFQPVHAPEPKIRITWFTAALPATPTRRLLVGRF